MLQSEQRFASSSSSVVPKQALSPIHPVPPPSPPLPSPANLKELQHVQQQLVQREAAIEQLQQKLKHSEASNAKLHELFRNASDSWVLERELRLRVQDDMETKLLYAREKFEAEAFARVVQGAISERRSKQQIHQHQPNSAENPSVHRNQSTVAGNGPRPHLTSFT